MNQTQKMFIALCLIAGPFLGSCDKNDDSVSCNYATELEVELNAVVAALQTYSLDPTTANCNAYKTSLQTYLDAAEDYRNCAGIAGQAAQFQASLDQQQAALDAIQC